MSTRVKSPLSSSASAQLQKNLTSRKTVPTQVSSVAGFHCCESVPGQTDRPSVWQCSPLSDHCKPEMSVTDIFKTENIRDKLWHILIISDENDKIRPAQLPDTDPAKMSHVMATTPLLVFASTCCIFGGVV